MQQRIAPTLTKCSAALLLLILTCAAVRSAPSKTPTLPASFPRCNTTLSQADYEDCLQQAIQKAFHLISNKGIASLGVYPIDPLEVSEIAIGEGAGAVRLQLTLSKAKLQGLNDTRLLNASNDIPQGGARMMAEILIPRLQIISDYEVNGHVLLLPIKGQGPSNITLEQVRVLVRIENDKVTRDEQEYLKIKNFKINIKPKGISIHLKNLFGGDPIIGTHMERFILENSEDVFRELQKPIEEAFSAIFSQISARIFDQVPYKTIFVS